MLTTVNMLALLRLYLINGCVHQQGVSHRVHYFYASATDRCVGGIVFRLPVRVCACVRPGVRTASMTTPEWVSGF